ncbi:farnesyl pyrophosphate synthase [Fopius arisanus]|uniref:Farnesyl pyrophosphate synthase n=2 Tax=Fopius arisanus TaxID=64838 RepID=A0A9R1TPH6_9HYME|nr:PREDICTED: farnesyl pyrophosphate synthase [Fopius arisanus]XP_011312482.1 PREDICTED: farnesyl pyrophosphate synthase [Fopius arisanus]XP_011312483.1 PREDICTED: farnesyl pyrophosphate synthase [Fopius arisanus]
MRSSVRYLLQNGLQRFTADGGIMRRFTCSIIHGLPSGYDQDHQMRSVRMTHSMAQKNWVSSRDESREMMGLWPDIVRDLTEAGRHLDIPDATKWMAKVLQSNVPNGKKNRGLALVYAYRKLVSPEHLTESNLRMARILGWCTELHQAFFLVEDDIMDRSKTRRGQPCWYLHNNIGLAAINDGIILEQALYQLLRTHFKKETCYVDLLETFHETTMKTTMGQTLDLLSTNFGSKPNLNLFTMDRYNAIVKYKTAYYSFVMPVTLAMYFAGVTDPEMHRQAKTILLEMGHFFQVQDDYLDCYGDPGVTGKNGTDIQEGKCSWLAVVALQRATPAQRQVLKDCYGFDEVEKVARVKQLYDDLGLPTTYAIYEEESYNLMNTHIQQISRGLPHDLFFKFLSKIYRRDA